VRRGRFASLAIAPALLAVHCGRLADPVAEVGAATESPVAPLDDAGSADAGASSADAGSASLDGDVMGCADCAEDGSAPAAGDALCVLNPSFEDAPYPQPVPDWPVCLSNATSYTKPSWLSLPASNGSNYVGVMASTTTSLNEVQQATLCDPPLRGGVRSPFSVDMTMSSEYGPFGAAFLQLWGGTAMCTPEELLWTSPLVDQLDTWKTYCGALTPSKDYPYLILVPTVDSAPDAASASGGYLLIDNFGWSDACR
jgi:hypothetical protein